MEMLILEKTIEGFSFNQIQITVSVYKKIKEAGYEMSDLVSHLDFLLSQAIEDIERREQQSKDQIAKWRQEAPKCPLCSEPLLFRKIGLPMGRANLQGFRTNVVCSSE